MKKAAYVCFALVLISAILIFNGTTILAVSEVESKRLVFAEKVDPGQVFMVKWIHSVELEPWEEHFEVGDDMEIYLEKTRFKAFGAGVPDSAGTATAVEDGYVTFTGIHRKMPNLVYGVSPIAKHTFVMNGKSFPLYEILPPDSAVSFRIEKIRLWKYLFYKLSSGLNK